MSNTARKINGDLFERLIKLLIRKGLGGDLCTHSRPCAQGFVCVFGDENIEVDRYEDETGECQTKAEVEILKRSLP